jgi:hypothetical protein
MRRTLIFSALSLLCCNQMLAADGDSQRWRISILASELALSQNQPWSDDPHAGIGVGIAYAPTSQWDVELTASSQTHVSPLTILTHSYTPDTPPVTYTSFQFERYRVTPLDLSVTRHFLADQPIAPYLRAGIRHVGAPRDPSPVPMVFNTPYVAPYPQYVQVPGSFHLSDRTSAQAGAGVRVRLTPRTALRGEVTRLLRSDSADFDPLTRYAMGVSWVF